MLMTLNETKKYITNRCDALWKRYLLENVVTIKPLINESHDGSYAGEMISNTEYNEITLIFTVPDTGKLVKAEVHRLVDHEMFHCLLYELDWLRRNFDAMEDAERFFLEVGEKLVTRLMAIKEKGGFNEPV